MILIQNHLVGAPQTPLELCMVLEEVLYMHPIMMKERWVSSPGMGQHLILLIEEILKQVPIMMAQLAMEEIQQ